MKAISLWQPWATLVAIGAKRIETRSWATSYRGPLAIHATQAFPNGARYWCAQLPFREYLHEAFIGRPEGQHICDALPRGVVVATCELAACVPIKAGRVDWHPQVLKLPPGSGIITVPPADPEFRFGDYTPGRWAWILRDVRRLPEPIPAKGRQGLWDWDRPLDEALFPVAVEPERRRGDRL